MLGQCSGVVRGLRALVEMLLYFSKSLLVRALGAIMAILGFGVALWFPGGFIYLQFEQYLEGEVVSKLAAVPCIAVSVMFWYGVRSTKLGARLTEWYLVKTLTFLKFPYGADSA